MRSHTKSVCVYLVDTFIPVYLKKKKLLPCQYFFVWKCAWWGKAENGVGGKEMEFFLLNGIKLVKMHSAGKLIYLAINTY